MNARNDLELKKVYEIAKEISLKRSEAIMTIAEKLITEGMEKGINNTHGILDEIIPRIEIPSYHIKWGESL